MNFRPSAVARSLIQNKTRAIGVIVSDISNPFYPELMKGIDEHAADRGYTIILTNSDDELDKHARALAVLRRHDLIAGARQVHFHQPHDMSLVIHRQYLFGHLGCLL